MTSVALDFNGRARLDDRQRKALDDPRAVSARVMREVSVTLESMASAAEQHWFELPEHDRAEMRLLAVNVKRQLDAHSPQSFNPIIAVRAIRSALIWWNHAGDVMLFSSALQRFIQVVMR